MKSIVLVLLLLLSAIVYAQDQQPKLSLVQASQIAQKTLESLQLGPEYYLRSIQLVPRTPENPEPRYESQYEPTAARSVKAGSDARSYKYRVIVVNMDGKSQVAERESRVRRVPATKVSE